MPSTGWPSDLVAPRKASRPSASSLRTSTPIAASSSIAFTNSSRFLASRIAAVATILITSAPTSPARRTCVVTTSATSAIFSAVIVPFLLASLPILV